MKANGAPPARAMNLPFTPAASQRPEPAAARSVAANPDAQRVQASLDRSRRQQADLLLAQWAAQQMAQQNRVPSPSADDDRKQDDRARAQSANAPHPMLRPRNASPEWYAQAMDRALSQYRGGLNARTAQLAHLSLQR